MAQIFEPVRFANLTVKNRVIRSATNEHLSSPDGNVTPELMKAYLDCAKGGCGLFITGHYTVDRDRRADPGQAVLDDGVNLELLKDTIDQMHACGTTVFAQVSQPGPKAMVFANGAAAQKPADYSAEQLETLKQQFINGAALAQKAGFDGIQLHLAHGYCLCSFLDPAENARTDLYGGPFENRFRIVSDIIAGIRVRCGTGFPIAVKLNCNSVDASIDYTADFAKAVQACKARGVAFCEISGATFAAKPASLDEPYYLAECQKAGVIGTMPLALVGGLDSRAKMQTALDAGFDLVSLSRALICQPDFVNKLQKGEADTSPCTRCRGCYRVFRTRHVRCVQHTTPIAQLQTLFG